MFFYTRIYISLISLHVHTHISATGQFWNLHAVNLLLKNLHKIDPLQKKEMETVFHLHMVTIQTCLKFTSAQTVKTIWFWLHWPVFCLACLRNYNLILTLLTKWTSFVRETSCHVYLVCFSVVCEMSQPVPPSACPCYVHNWCSSLLRFTSLFHYCVYIILYFILQYIPLLLTPWNT